MNPAIKTTNAIVYLADCRAALRDMQSNSVDSIVTDPPYELGFMGKSWDSTGIAYDQEVWRQCLRVLKPGGHLLAFGGTRTWHRLAVAVEESGFEIRDSIAWIYGSGFPKSHNIEKATGDPEYAGWGTALKPAHEPIVVARKPLIGTVALNVLKYGVGGLNIDATRIAGEVPSVPQWSRSQDNAPYGAEGRNGVMSQPSMLGRFPANIIFDEYTAELLDQQSGISKSVSANRGLRYSGNHGGLAGELKQYKEGTDGVRGHSDSGGASRFFYVAKASKRDRNEGLDELPLGDRVFMGSGGRTMKEGVWVETNSVPQQRQNFHPTVKPTALMRYLIKLVTPQGGTVLDPFTGSGSTGKAAILEGNKFIGIELTEEYLPIIEGRLDYAEDTYASELYSGTET